MLRKYFIMGSQNCLRDPIVILQEALEAGITAFQYREKGTGSLTGMEKVTLGKQLRTMCREYKVPFIVNDDIGLVEALDADGIHVGQDDFAVEYLRENFPNLIIGLSISNSEELANSNTSVIDYIGAGPVFLTRTKEDAKTVTGLEWIRQLRREEPLLPIVGIGGINESNASQIIEAGADGVSVISAITHSENIDQTIKLL